MLTIYRRHIRNCNHRSEGRKYRRCRCPIWVDGFLAGEEIRKATGLRDWEEAQRRLREWEATAGETKTQAGPTTLTVACEKYQADAKARRLTESTIYKYELLFRQLKGFADRAGIRYLKELDVDTLGTFRAEWKDGPLSGSKKLERLRAFLHFAERRKWISENPARELKAPRVSLRPTLPFSHEDLVRLLAAAKQHLEKSSVNGRDNARRISTLILLLRYSGMRIGDAVSLNADRLSGNRLFLYTAKTGVPVHTVLPAFVVNALDATPRMTPKLYFWNGSGKLSTGVKMWETRLKKLFTLAKVSDGHAHRFRDTFAVELLLAGVPLERVSILLGHSGIRVTEQHYSPWVRSRQEQLEADIAHAWSRDPMVLLETKGTLEVHGEREVLN